MQTVLKRYLAFVVVAGALGCKPSSTQSEDQTKMSLQEEIHSARVKSGVPTLVVGVATSDKVSVAADGVRKIGDTSSVTTADFFHLGSNTKAFTCMLAGIMVDKGNINWSARVIDIMPELASSMLSVYDIVTLEDLLRHRFGLPPFTTEEEARTIPNFEGSPMEQRTQFCIWVFSQQNVAVPRDTNIYSNAGIVVAAAMLERAMNRPYEDMLQEKILLPLGLHAKFGFPASGGLNQPWGHTIGTSGGLGPVNPDDQNYTLPMWANPTGNLSISMEDYARFLQAILKAKKGDESLLSKQSFLKIMIPESGYGMGWVAIEYTGRSLLCHTGTNNTFYAIALLDFERNLAVAAFTNSWSSDIEMKMQIGAFYFHDISLK